MSSLRGPMGERPRGPKYWKPIIRSTPYMWLRRQCRSDEGSRWEGSARRHLRTNVANPQPKSPRAGSTGGSDGGSAVPARRGSRGAGGRRGSSWRSSNYRSLHPLRFGNHPMCSDAGTPHLRSHIARDGVNSAARRVTEDEMAIVAQCREAEVHPESARRFPVPRENRPRGLI
jgi:hypothetical protein